MEYLIARKVLLDTLDLLQPHVSSLILVGAQGARELDRPRSVAWLTRRTATYCSTPICSLPNQKSPRPSVQAASGKVRIPAPGKARMVWQ